MTSQGTAHGRFTRAVASGNLREAEMAARELGGLSLDDALKLCVMLAERDAPRFERAALRWLARFIEERLPPIAEVALAATALAELRHGARGAGRDSLGRLALRLPRRSAAQRAGRWRRRFLAEVVELSQLRVLPGCASELCFAAGD